MIFHLHASQGRKYLDDDDRIDLSVNGSAVNSVKGKDKRERTATTPMVTTQTEISIETLAKETHARSNGSSQKTLQEKKDGHPTDKLNAHANVAFPETNEADQTKTQRYSNTKHMNKKFEEILTFEEIYKNIKTPYFFPNRRQLHNAENVAPFPAITDEISSKQNQNSGNREAMFKDFCDL